MSKILVVDDDPHIRELITVFLSRAGFEVFQAVDGMEALSKLETLKVDLIVLDIMLPGMDGWEFCRQLRAVWDTPVLMLSAKGETNDKVKGFQLGTDDYLVKPFEPVELVFRVKALLKRCGIASAHLVQLGELVINHKTHEVLAQGENLTLPLKEFELLFKLASYPGKTLSRDQLIEEIWGYAFEGNERTLDVHINRLRQRFSEEVYGFRITAIRGLGYRLEVSR